MRAILGLGLALATGCAQIETRTDVQIIRTPDSSTHVVGPPTGKPTARGAQVQWTQTGSAVSFDVFVTHQCTPLRHEPVQRVETITRTTGGALYWEFGIGGVLLAAGLTGLLAPQVFGQSVQNANGEIVQDTRAGYRVGGIFTGLSAVALGAGTYDAVRSRDEVVTTDAHIVHRGEPGPCAEPQTPVTGRTVELVVGDWQATAKTDDHGTVRFDLPPSDAPPPYTPIAPDPLGVPSVLDRPVEPPPQALRHGVLRLGGRAALPFDFVAPYGVADAQEHRGEVLLDPAPIRQAPPRPRPASPP